MTTPRDSLPKTSPLVQKKKPPARKGVDTRGMLSIVTMLVSLAAISIALFGGSKLIYDILELGLDEVGNIPVKLLVMSFPFVFGWVTGIISIRGFGNLIYPIIIRIYSWGCLIATGFLYFKVISKLLVIDYNGLKLGTYLVMLLGILFVLFCLHLLVDGHDLRPYAIPLLVISVVHLFVIVYHYVIMEAPGGFSEAMSDFLVFLLMITISGLMLMHMGIFTRVREAIGDLFAEKAVEVGGNGQGNGNGNGAG
jgi:hypothetical protein